MRGAVLIASSLIFAAPAFAGDEPPAAAEAAQPAATSSAAYRMAIEGDDEGLQAFIGALPKVRIKSPEGTVQVYRLMEGDILATEAQVEARIRELRARTRPASGVPSGELLVLADAAGNPVIWPKGARALTYAVDRASFRSADEYEVAAENLAKATADWIAACPDCGLSFTHAKELDDASPTTAQVNFVVTFLPGATGFVAAAPFPNDIQAKRLLVVGPQYFTTSFDRIGVFRHELGHVLGYRHMHIIGVPGCDTEDANWLAVSKTYDPLSVMHYLCGEGGTREMRLSDTDKRDHRTLYQ
ncbi:hypothetical protein [Hansschlegelia zhihuaiae]|uniref:Matrixin family metalloprotease n=1 Tax=Hansschlegelia zhihuaiae TaxID=405005 RepID=A0A4Q0MI75_9HYPH|nr:hypothetical protein [Hansschlegelia zhihuaiae]RXF73317.1 hypothetical protein EK403_10850 [Hansschlegelia zhihuaiae]